MSDLTIFLAGYFIGAFFVMILTALKGKP